MNSHVPNELIVRRVSHARTFNLWQVPNTMKLNDLRDRDSRKLSTATIVVELQLKNETHKLSHGDAVNRVETLKENRLETNMAIGLLFIVLASLLFWMDMQEVNGFDVSNPNSYDQFEMFIAHNAPSENESGQ